MLRFPLPFAALASLAAGPLLAACSTTHGVRPIGRGAVTVDASLGGPVTEVFGAPVPLPLTTLGTTVGATDTTDVHAAWHPTGILFGVFAADVGAAQQFVAPAGARPRLMGDLTLTFGAGDRDAAGPEGGFRFFAQPSLTASWDWGRRRQHTVYAGGTAFLQPADEFAALAGFYLGNQFGTGRSRLTLELKWLQPWADNEPIVPEFYAPGDLGALAVQLGYSYRFGGKP